MKNLYLFMTELASADNVQVLIPNAQVWGAAPLTNLSVYPTRRLTVTVPVALDRDVKAIEVKDPCRPRSGRADTENAAI